MRLLPIRVYEAGACRVLKGDYIGTGRPATMAGAGACRVLKGDYIRAAETETGECAGACRVLKGDYIVFITSCYSVDNYNIARIKKATVVLVFSPPPGQFFRRGTPSRRIAYP